MHISGNRALNYYTIHYCFNFNAKNSIQGGIMRVCAVTCKSELNSRMSIPILKSKIVYNLR